MRMLPLAAAILWACVAAYGEPGASVPTKDLANVKPLRFDVDEKDLSDAGLPVVQPQYTVRLDREFGGAWITVGDLDGDGVAEIVSAKNGGPMGKHYTSAVVVHKLDGAVLWKWGDPATRNVLSHDVACQIYDLDGDGRNEVIVAADRKVIVFDGATGREKWQFAIPQDASDCIVFCNLSGGGRATDILVKTRYEQIWAYDCRGRQLWTSRKPGGYITAHQPFAVDLDGDGRDEIMAGFAMLNSDGSVRWTIPSVDGKPLQSHVDAIRLFADGPRPEGKRLLVSHCGGKQLSMLDGTGKLLWRDVGVHFESIFFGRLDPALPGRQLVIDDAHQPWGKDPLLILDEQGTLLGRYTMTYSRLHRLVDWFGTGTDLIFCGQSRALFNAQGKKVARFDTPLPAQAEIPKTDKNPLKFLVHLADVNGDQRPDIVVSTLPGAVVWVYVNEKGPKGLDKSRLVLPTNATLY